MERSAQSLRYVEGRRIIVAGVVVNVCLAIIKVAGGILGRSQALVADGFHSLSDLATDLVVFFGLRYSSKPRDANHPYGHGKIETLATTFVGLLLVVTGCLLGYGGVVSAFAGPSDVPHWAALVAAFLSIVFKEGLYRYTLRYARRLNSHSLVANAWHHRSDALSSVAALGGIAGAQLGLPILDPIGAILVAVMIVKVGAEVVIPASRELVEETLQDEETARMIDCALAVRGVRSVPEIHSRHVGPTIVVDLSIGVDGELTVSEGHTIAHRVEERLVERIAEIEVVTVHVEPAPPPAAPPSRSPPRPAASRRER